MPPPDKATYNASQRFLMLYCSTLYLWYALVSSWHSFAWTQSLVCSSDTLYWLLKKHTVLAKIKRILFASFRIRCSGYIFVHSSTYQKRTWNSAPVFRELLSSEHEWKLRTWIFFSQRKIEVFRDKELAFFWILSYLHVFHIARVFF